LGDNVDEFRFSLCVAVVPATTAVAFPDDDPA
jgi:hypothetical protein